MTALSAENKYILNRYFGAAGQKVGLGDLMEDALTVAVGELTTTTEGYVAVGNASGVATYVPISGDVTIAATGAVTIANGAVETVMIADSNVTTAKIADDAVTAAKLAAGSVVEASLDLSQMVLDFTTRACLFSGPGSLGAAVDTDNAVNAIVCGPHSLYWHNINTQTIGVNYVPGSGLNIAGDQTDNDGLEVNCGDLTSQVSKVVDTDNFYFRAKLSIADWSGTDALAIGLRKAQAHENAFTSYTDFYALTVSTAAASAALKLGSNINGAGAAETDTTDTAADGEYVDVKIWVGDEARLQTSIDLATALKATMNAHYADQGATGEEHIAADTAIASATPTDTATLITLVTEMMASYVAHEADAVLAADWVYHQAQTSDDDSLTSEVAPTTLAECVTRLNDLKAKLNLHMADSTAHTAGDSTAETVVDACNTYVQLGIDGALTDPTATRSFNFDAGDTIVPFIHLTQASASQTGAAYLSAWEIKNVTTA